MKITVQIETYDVKELKNLLVRCMSEASVQEDGTKTLKKTPMSFVAGLIPSGSIEGLLSLVSKTGFINRFICKKITQTLRKYVGSEKFAVKKVIFEKWDDQGMKLHVELDELDLDALIDKVLTSVREAQRKKELEQGKEGLSKNQEVLFATLLVMNQEITREQKIKLLQVLLDWANDCKLISKLLDTLMDEDEELGSTLRPLNLKIGNITLEDDAPAEKETTEVVNGEGSIQKTGE